MTETDFNTTFRAITGMTKPDEQPFPWQWRLYQEFAQGRFRESCSLPTGLGKTSVIHIWLLALATNPEKVPRRLVYVVNRRTVVDQSTDEAVKMRTRLANAAELAGVMANLRELWAGKTPADIPLAISTLRGQFADNREWSADPTRPAVICGTVDMIGSRLLFSGYGCGFKSRPLHAGFLGQDVLLVHDEAHLEPAFQGLLIAIRDEQERCKEFGRFHVTELTATSRGGSDQFGLEKEDWDDPTVQKRIEAKKAIHLHAVEKKVTDDIVKYGKGEHTKDRAVLIFVRQVKDVEEIVKKLPKGTFEQLTGTLRGKERDDLVKKPIFQRFLPESNRDPDVTPQPGTVYLVCTSAGEVGVNISADHLVCDLSTFDSMAQRFGRVNRFGAGDARIDVVHPPESELRSDEAEAAEKKKEKQNTLVVVDAARRRTLELLRKLNGDASPAALGDIHRKALQEGSGTPPMSTDRAQALRDYILATYAPQPTTLPTSDILFDAWALTTIRDLPGRPSVDEYLHGVEDEKQRETHVAWRQEVDRFAGTTVTVQQLAELLDEFPLKPHELLRDVTWRIQDELAALAEGRERKPAWVVEPDDTVRVVMLGDLAKKDNKKRYVENLIGRTVVLPPSVGGLTATGTFSGEEPHVPEREYDVAGLIPQQSGYPLVRLIVTPNDGDPIYKPLAPVRGLSSDYSFRLNGKTERAQLCEAFPDPFPPMRVAYRLDLSEKDAEADEHGDYLVLKPESRERAYRHEAAWPSLDAHGKGVQSFAEEICKGLRLPEEITRAVTLAAAWHDFGKDRGVWQRGAGNVRANKPVAKTLHGRPPENLNGFRHELASMIDVRSEVDLLKAFESQAPEVRELILHLIAAHHGRGRPHFPVADAFDPERAAAAAEVVATETPRRFARLQRKYGRWGLAYLESLVRAADALDSRRIEDTPIGEAEPGAWPKPAPSSVWVRPAGVPEPTIRVAVDATNPGQFFACCGLLELADRVWPGAEGWFAEGQFHIACGGTVTELMTQLTGARIDSSLSSEQRTRLATLLSKAKDKLTATDLEDKARLQGMWRVERLHLSTPFDVWLDWWRDDQGERTELKTWAAKQMVAEMAQLILDVIRFAAWSKVPDPDDLFKWVQCDSLPFNFDSDLIGQGAARDAGFSADTLGLKSAFRPLLELLAFVGLQRFRPTPVRDETFRFCLWTTPLPPSIAAAAAGGAIELAGEQQYEFSLFSRTKYMKAFLPSQPRKVPHE